MSLPTAEILERTFRISAFDPVEEDWHTAASVVIDLDGKQYLVTCKHIFKDAKSGLNLDIEKEDVELRISASFEDIGKSGQGGQSIDQPLPYSFVGFGSEGSDIAVLANKPALGNLLDIRLFGEEESAKISLGGEVGILGFPEVIPIGPESARLGTSGLLPAVQRGYISYFRDGDSPRVVYIGAMNSRGFSGGPAYVRDPRVGATLVGIVGSYRPHRNPVLKDGKETKMYVSENTGIMTATYIKHAIDAIQANPIGLSLTP